jgi:hypothetical protein
VGNNEHPRDAFVADLICDDDEPPVLMFGAGDHTCVRWRLDEKQMDLIAAKWIEHRLGR